jgi:hypothetical protein
LEKRQGERRSRLERGQRHGEVMFLRHVWWPMVGSFEYLHPGYEVLNRRDDPIAQTEGCGAAVVGGGWGGEEQWSDCGRESDCILYS